MDDLKESREKIPTMTCTTLRIKAYPCNRKPPRNLAQNTATIRWSNSGGLHYLLIHKSKIFSHLDGYSIHSSTSSGEKKTSVNS